MSTLSRQWEVANLAFVRRGRIVIITDVPPWNIKPVAANCAIQTGSHVIASLTPDGVYLLYDRTDERFDSFEVVNDVSTMESRRDFVERMAGVAAETLIRCHIEEHYAGIAPDYEVPVTAAHRFGATIAECVLQIRPDLSPDRPGTKVIKFDALKFPSLHGYLNTDDSG